MKGSGNCTSRKNINLSSSVKLSLEDNSSKFSFTKDKRIVLNKTESGWTALPSSKSDTYDQDIDIGVKHGYIMYSNSYKTFLSERYFETLEEIIDFFTEIYKNEKIQMPNFNTIAHNFYYVKENNDFFILKNKEHKWTINYDYEEKYASLFEKELKGLIFDKRSEALSHLEQWFAHHNIEMN